MGDETRVAFVSLICISCRKKNATKVAVTIKEHKDLMHKYIHGTKLTYSTHKNGLEKSQRARNAVS